jgi:histidinol-phosphate phosphatase family protein
LDRDGTIIRDANYVRDPRDVELLPKAAAAIRRLNEADIAVIIVTNQSGIARKLLTREDYEAVRSRLDDLLALENAHITATFMCPHHPDVAGECDCRKPGLGMYRAAIAEYGIDPTRSVFIGDRYRDVAPARSLGGHGILLDIDSTPDEDRRRVKLESIPTATNLADAVEQFLRALPA